MGDGTKENPYTREDVLRLIEENGGTAEGLDLSRKVFERGVNLSNLDLGGIILKKARLSDANLEEAKLRIADLRKADLFEVTLKGADLFEANLEEASLICVNLEKAWLANANLERAILVDSSIDGADLYRANLKGTHLTNTSLSYDSKLWKVDWGDFILGDERGLTEAKGEKRKEYLVSWEIDNIYRRLKIWHTEHGLYDIAGKFFYREMEVKRKVQSWKRPHLKLWSWVIRLLCGYGEKPERVGISAAVVIFGLAAAYYFWGSFSSSSFWDTLYYSATSFTALGYGQWAPQPTGWARGMGAAEAIIGVFMMALFLVTFTRKMTR